MHEIGQPLHAFDFDKLNNINVKSLKAGTKFKTLDDVVGWINDNYFTDEFSAISDGSDD